MPDQPPALPFGAAVSFAERSMTALLKRSLREIDVSPAQWYALSWLVLRGPRVTREDLEREVAQARDVGPAVAAEAVRSLLARGDVDVEGPDLVLTSSGAATHRMLRDRVGAVTATLLGPIDEAALATTHRTLTALHERADALARAES